MFPFFEPLPGIFIYSFGLTLVICFFLFLWMFKRLSLRQNYDYGIISRNTLWYFLSVFIFSRLIYVISKWNDLKYIKNPYEFFIMSDYNFSLAGAMLGFLALLYLHLHFKKEKLNQYIDGLCLSFLFVASIGYIGGLLGGQVYGRETMYGIEIAYTHAFTPIPFQVPVFPLPIVYALIYFLLFSILYIASMFINTRGLIGYLGFIAFASIQLMLEFFSGKTDVLKNMTGVNLNQFFALIFVIFCIHRLYLLYKNDK